MSTVLGTGLPIFAGARARGRLVRFDTPDDVIRIMDEGDEAALDVVALVKDAGATFLAPIEADLAGIVCRAGNIESHLAIVSRDFQIPSLMAFSFTAEEPADGTLVELDCDAGTLSLAEG
jgi:phosphoenolpyruvate-protein kinase (PTS system EI component)